MGCLLHYQAGVLNEVGERARRVDVRRPQRYVLGFWVGLAGREARRAAEVQWGPAASVAVGSSKQDRHSLDLTCWWLYAFPGSAADGISLFERLEQKLEEHPGSCLLDGPAD